jgi:RND family efflux transporter, MFP subunit
MNPRALPVTASLLAIALVACSQHEPPVTATASGPAVAASVIRVQAADLPQTLSVPGIVSSARSATLSARTGGRVSRIAVNAGEQVTKGQLLAVIGAAQARSDLASAQAKLAQTNSSYSVAKTDNLRYQALRKQGAASPREYENMHARYLSARAARDAARSAVAAARSALADAELHAPFAGLVASKSVDDGDLVQPGAPLFVISGGQAQVRTQVSGSQFHRLQLGDALTVDVDGQHYDGKIIELVDAADAQTRTYPVKLALPAGAAVAVGDFARVELPIGSQRALAVPASAVVERAGLRGVFVVDAHGVSHFRQVRTANHVGDKVVITAGLADGERIVLAPPPALGNGSRVEAGRAP